MRSSKTDWYMEMALSMAKRSTCLRRKYGAVIIDTAGHIVSTGYNGAPRSTIDCLEKNICWRETHHIAAGTHYEKCYAVHAEQNALLQAGLRA